MTGPVLIAPPPAHAEIGLYGSTANCAVLPVMRLVTIG
jgi:hypothetical protein